MTPILVVGYHGKRNFGDDIFLHVTLSLLTECTGVTDFLVSGCDASLPALSAGFQVAGVSKSTHRISRLMWLEIMLAGLRSRSVVFAAGSIFSVIPFGLVWLSLLVLRLLKGSQFRVVALGVSTGPYRSRMARLLSRWMFSTFDRIQLRDRQSVVDLVRLTRRELVDIAPDIALISPYFSITPTARPDPSRRTLGICIHSRAVEANGESLDQFVAALGEAVAIRSDLERLRILVACTDPKDGDIALSQRLIGVLRNRTDLEIDLVCYSGSNLSEFTASIQDCSCIITSRMHVGLAALCAGVSTVQLDYAEKVRNVFETLGVEFALVDARVNNIRQIVDRLVRECHSEVHLRQPSDARRLLHEAAKAAAAASKRLILTTLSGAKQ